MSSLASSHSPRIILIQNFKQLETWSSQTAVHRKKFEFALSQLRNFTQSYAKVADNTLLTPQEIIASNDFSNLLSELRQVMIKNLLQIIKYKWRPFFIEKIRLG